MKNNIVKAASIAAFIAIGLTACTGAPENNAAPNSSSTPSSTVTSTTAPSSTSIAVPPPTVTEQVTETVTAQPKQPQAVANKVVDNRPGYGALKIGMSLAEANATGMVNLSFGAEHEGLCVADKTAAISRSYGVERITLPAAAKTSAGIGVGATYADVKRAYPAAKEYRGGYTVRMQNFIYSFDAAASAEHYQDSDKVGQIKILTADAAKVNCAFAQL